MFNQDYEGKNIQKAKIATATLKSEGICTMGEPFSNNKNG
jgi:hypothetical protein